LVFGPLGVTFLKRGGKYINSLLKMRTETIIAFEGLNYELLAEDMNSIEAAKQSVDFNILTLEII
jgi:hypothetical protein